MEMSRNGLDQYHYPGGWVVGGLHIFINELVGIGGTFSRRKMHKVQGGLDHPGTPCT